MRHGHTCSYSENKVNLLRRLKKIEGQIKGIQRMIEKEKYCADILIQIAAVRAALNKVGLIIFEDHTKGCVVEAIQTDSGDEKIDELVDVLHKFLK
ncbi:MAG TPA: metal-sensitive transcriptional regulator [Thermoanaerobacterales bacterium]|uniref:metal-sensitive transcriptional regulator n=1 Tax=Tepidanaerobacter sp. GT38 TaxID=2722793 RepID=UPI0017CEAEBF|nr:metal-sensitive transcriptional regulator [Tepidanaerobacter sp. GT38]MCG1012920.1 metal-sensitive transcriptional regulator [Tepidanaerobacter sp. GT38]HHY41992.1 metal-sensitive transcriptional regulator [Thermoanaerobacterales bacterium]